MIKIRILSKRKVKITKIKPYMILFTCHSHNYLLHLSEGDLGECYYELYKRELNNNGNYKLTHIKSVFADNDLISDFIMSKSNKYHHNGMTYKEINIEHFINKLVKYGFAESFVEKEPLDNKKKEILKSYCGCTKIKNKLKEVIDEIGISETLKLISEIVGEM